MGLPHPSWYECIMVLIFFIQKITLASSFLECHMCNDCLMREDENCFCVGTYAYGYEFMMCKNVQMYSHLDSDIFRYYRKIQFQDSHIEHLTTNFFAEAQNIDEIFLNGTEIENIQVGAFSSLTSVQILHLQENKLSRVYRGCFNSLFHLKVLDLHSNQINSIEEESFHGLNSLENLNLGDNRLNILSSSLFSYLNKLQTLNISKNSLTTINFQLSNSPHMGVMPFNDNDYDGVNTDTSTNALSTLDLSDNEIHELPEEPFRNMRNLITLNISKNDISELKISMFSHLEGLNTLNMHSLKLKSLEIEDFVLLSHLKTLNIKSNNLKFFDKDILNFCPDLQSIAIDGNHFSCSVVASLIMNSKRRNIAIEYSPNYQEENIDGIKCTRKVENYSEISKDISNILHEEIQIVFREILNNGSNGIKINGNVSQSKSFNKLADNKEKIISDTQFSEFLKLIKNVQNSTSIERLLSNMSSIMLEMKSSNLNLRSKILDKIEQIEHNIANEKLLTNISRKVEERNISSDQFYNKFMTNISDTLTKMEVSYEQFYNKFYKAIKSIENNTFHSISDVENADMNTENETHNNPIFQHLSAALKSNEEDKEQMSSVTTKLNNLIFFSIICFFIIFLKIIYVISEKKIWLKLQSLTKHEEVCDEMSSLAD